jgi:hypothetical protein
MAVLTATLLLALIPERALSGKLDKPLPPCGEVVKRQPTKRLGEGRPPLIIGDSLVGHTALPYFLDRGFRTDTQYCRTFYGGLVQLRKLKNKAKPLPELVIMQVGMGGKLRWKMILRARKMVGRERRLGLVTPREFRPKFGIRKRRLIRDAAKKFDNVLLFDWDRYSKRLPRNWFYGDNIHPNEKGSEAMSNFFAAIAFEIGDPWASEPYADPR